MKKALRRIENKTYYYKDNIRVEGIPDDIRGNLDECEITDKDREKGIEIDELVKD